MALLELTECSLEAAIKSIIDLNSPKVKLFKKVSYGREYENYLCRNYLEDFSYGINDISNILVADMKFINFSKELEELNILADKIKEEENNDI